MTYEDMLFEKENGYAILTLNRPDKLNAISMGMREGLAKVAEEVRDDDDIKALVITGAGRAFCSGADVSGQAARLSGEVQIPRWFLLEPLGSWLLPIRDLAKPTIAAVNGTAAGIGWTLALICDMILASDQARFSAIWVKRALVPDGGASHLIPRMVGTAKALELMLTGDFVDAKEAERLGLVNRVVPHDELMAAAKELAGKIAKGPPITIELTKRAVYRGMVNDLERQLDFETYAQNICRGTEDHKEGVTAFLQKRDPQFRGV
ncbi:MAG: enoyl-CoA hydratase [Chloroflexota bacterium]|nr:enoyl-CoA hydratase [Chloroflexota bacterium]